MERKQFNWTSYHEKTRAEPPSKNLLIAMEFVRERNAALDIGAGSLKDSTFLVKSGFEEVIAVDQQPYTTGLPEEVANKITVVTSTFETYDFPQNHFDIVSAQFSLPFTSPEHFQHVFDSLTDSLVEGGIFAGQFFGTKDSWADRKNMTFHVAEEIEALLTPYEVLARREIDEDGEARSGELKHWHVFTIVASKR